jgi:hypothetical protein
MTMSKLKKVSKKTGKSMSAIIDSVVDKCLKE